MYRVNKVKTHPAFQLSSACKCLIGILLFTIATAIQAQEIKAPHIEAGGVNQLIVSGNACGPAALLTAFRIADDATRKVDTAIPGSSDRSKLLYIIRAHGLRPSSSIRNRPRWTRSGINPEDLQQVAKELAAIGGTTAPHIRSLLIPTNQASNKALAENHRILRNSLKNGFPPILAVRRYVWRKQQWQILGGHFITIASVPRKLPRKATSFSIRYYDPWKGQLHDGVIFLPPEDFLSSANKGPGALALDAPKINIAKETLKKNEIHYLSPTIMIGR